MRERFFEGKIFLAETYSYKSLERQDVNLRLSDPKALNSSSAAKGCQAITIFCVVHSLSRKFKQYLYTLYICAKDFY